MVNKARLFDNEVKTEGQLSAPKIVNVLVEFKRKMEATLVKMQKLPGSQPKPIWLPIPFPKDTPQKNRATVELKTPHQHRPGKELVAEAGKVVTPAIVLPATTKVTEKEPETPKMTSSDPSPRKVSTRKKKKEPTPKRSMEEEEEGSSEEEEDVEMVSSSNEPGSEGEEEPEPETPPPQKKKIKTRTSKRKKSTPAFKTPISLKRPMKGKMPKKGESFQKKPKTK